MFRILFYFIFILSVALASFGIILSSRLRNNSRSEAFSTLLYYQVFILTFGFYGIWGQALIKTFLGSYISSEALDRFSNIALLMGLPFLVFAWLVLIQFSSGLSGRKNPKWFVPGFLLVNFAILFLLGYHFSVNKAGNPSILMRYYFIIFNVVYSLFASYLIHLSGRSRSEIHEHDKRIIAPFISLISFILSALLVFYTDQQWLALVFIFAFFLGNIFLPVYLSYGTLVTVLNPEREEDLPFEEFCKKYEISPREAEIIREICNGLSNKEISDKLFISLQTVKDHTHRIYVKTNVKSRVQLITLVKEEKLVKPT